LKGERTIITSCGSGMTAGVLWLGLKLLGVRKVGLYDEVSLAYIKTVFPRLSGHGVVLDWVCRSGSVEHYPDITMIIRCWYIAIDSLLAVPN
jgi:hypothetical protein